MGTSTTEVRTHMPNVTVLFHEKSHARFGSTQAQFLAIMDCMELNQVSDGDNIGYGIKVNEEDEYLITPRTSMDGRMDYQRLKNH